MSAPGRERAASARPLRVDGIDGIDGGSARPPLGRVDRRVHEFRARVLETAEVLFAERGVEATKIDDICEAADVAKRTLCNHFPTKAHIVGALAREAVSRMVALIEDARDSGRTTRERLALLFDALLVRTAGAAQTSAGASGRHAPVHRDAVGAFFHVAHGTPDATEGEIRVSDAIQSLLAAGGPAQLPPGCAADTFAEVVLGAIYATTLEWIHRDDYDLEARTAEVGAFLVNLLPGGDDAV